MCTEVCNFISVRLACRLHLSGVYAHIALTQRLPQTLTQPTEAGQKPMFVLCLSALLRIAEVYLVAIGYEPSVTS